ncbi:hypothetical protein [uncultured Methanolobus sp.]|uniref:hypothetical protein n=1 Tax=uncultured Methanolobus sp. TaxID=218300 RepID=UPI0029C786A5|nr:hypothetical protein [uncultured Methanolobus sp.]
MGELQEIRESIAYQWGLFIAGIPVGAGVFSAEMSAFVTNLISTTIFNTLPASDTGDVAISNYYSMLFLITVFGLMQGIGLGMLKKTAFSFGYIIGIFVMILVFGNALIEIAPSIVVGMIIALITVLIGIYLRYLTINKRENDYNYHRW